MLAQPKTNILEPLIIYKSKIGYQPYKNYIDE